jgi:hypothetical protein
MSRYHEGKSLDAVIRRLEGRAGRVREADGRSPDEMRDPDPRRRVDYVCTIGGQLCAIEHTSIEPFPGQVEMDIQSQALLELVERRFDNRSDAEFWQLLLPVDAVRGLSKRAAHQASDALVAWVDKNFATVPIGRYGSRYANPTLSETADGMPFRVSLHRWAFPDFAGGRSQLSGRFSVVRVVSGDMEAARIERLKKACADKFPKLDPWRDCGAKTVLVLEENDISLTNHMLVTEAMVLAEEGAENRPDEIYLVSTSLPDIWWVTCLRRDGLTYYEDDDERLQEIDPKTLVQLTSR